MAEISYVNPSLALVNKRKKKNPKHGAPHKRKKTGGKKKMAKKNRKSKNKKTKNRHRKRKTPPRIKSGPRKGQFRKRKGSKRKKARRNVLIEAPAKRNPRKKNKKRSNKKRSNKRRSNKKRNPTRARRNQGIVGKLKGLPKRLRASAIPVATAAAFFRADEWLSDPVLDRLGIDDVDSGAGKAVRAAIAAALGIAIDMVYRANITLTMGDWVRNALLVKILAETSRDFVEPALNLEPPDSGEGITVSATADAPLVLEATGASPLPPTGSAGFGGMNGARRGFGRIVETAAPMF